MTLGRRSAITEGLAWLGVEMLPCFHDWSEGQRRLRCSCWCGLSVLFLLFLSFMLLYLASVAPMFSTEEKMSFDMGWECNCSPLGVTRVG